MRSKSITLRIPVILHESGVELSKEEYGSFNEFMVGLLRYALAIHKPHVVTSEIAKLSFAEQDTIDDEIVKMFQSGKSKKGSWFQHLVKEAAASISDGNDIPNDRLAKELVRLLGTRKSVPNKTK